MSTEASTVLIGRTVGGKYLIESFLGGGAMGSVWKARQVSLDKTVAVKIMHRQLAGDDTFAARFHREARAASRLDHPNSIRVFDYGEEPDGVLYIAMEYCEGRDLHRVMVEDWPLSDERIIDILSQVLSALAVAHGMGVVHRDLKPDNILVQQSLNDEGHAVDVVKVCDFGIATIVEPRSDPTTKGSGRPNITEAGFIVGTPEFMSPEQARGEPVDARSDLYSIGVVLFRMLTGTLPFEAESALGVAVKHIFEEPTHPVEVNLEVNPRLAALCLKVLQKKPDDRHQSARELRLDLRAQTDDSPYSVNPASRRRSSRPSFAEVINEHARTLPSSPAPDRHPTLSGLPKATPPSMPAPRPLRRLTRFTPLLALGLLFAGLVVFKLARPRVALTDTAPATPKLLETASAAPPLPPPAPALTGEARPIDTAAPTIAGETPTPKSTVALSPSSVGAAPFVRAAPTATVSAIDPVVAAPPVTAPPAAPEPPPPAAVVPAPPPTPPLPPPAPTPAAPPPPAAPPFDPSTGRVSISGVNTTNGLPPSSVRSALGRANFNRCYQDALRVAGAPAGGSTNLHLAIDDTGHVISATASMGFLPGARACVEGAARSLRISNVDTGDATADVTLSFSPR